jgi:hypothetical protein
MLTAAIVAAPGCRVVCLRAYTRGQMRCGRGPRHLVAMDATIKIDGLHKRFGETQALDGMTFTVRPGRVTGFIGPNGAGKPVTPGRRTRLPLPMTFRESLAGRQPAEPHRGECRTRLPFAGHLRQAPEPASLLLATKSPLDTTGNIWAVPAPLLALLVQ